MLGPEWFFKPHTKAYNTPSNGNFYFQVWQSLSEYFNVIASSPLFQEYAKLTFIVTEHQLMLLEYAERISENRGQAQLLDE